MGNAVALSAEERTSLLLVDDDAAVLKTTRRMLERRGYHVVACGSGEEALAWLERQTFDVMLSDVHMPGTTGLRLLRAVRDRDLDIPVILVTGNPDVKTAAAAVEYGALQYLIKPVPTQSLEASIERAANAGRMARAKREYVEEFGSGVFPTDAKQKIVGTMVKLCHEMGKEIIAEGVEQAEERDALVHLGCDYLQGYFYAKPGPPFPAPRR